MCGDYGDGDGWTVVSRKSKGKGKWGVWSEAEWTEWNAERESNVNPKKTLDNLVKALGESGKSTQAFLQCACRRRNDGVEVKSAPAKKISNAAKAKQMSETERTAQVQALEKARDVLGNGPELEGQKAFLTMEIENLRKLKLDRKLGVEIERKKAFIERESARLLSLEESRVRLVAELSQRQQEMDKQKEEPEALQGDGNQH